MNQVKNKIDEWITGSRIEKLNKIKITKSMVDKMPKLDLHVHLPGTISANTAFQLGIRNNFIEYANKTWRLGRAKLGQTNPHKYYTDIFLNLEEAIFNDNIDLCNLHYNISINQFKSFDAIMATVQGHRHPPGGIQNEDDLCFVLRKYLLDCIAQNILYVELQQNIRIAYNLYPNLSPKDARIKLYKVLLDMASEFEDAGVILRFLHCFNKTQAAALDKTARELAIEGADWLEEAKQHAPNLFVGIEAAGHEKDQSGWPEHLAGGYKLAAERGFGCEAHGGEGIGVEHMLDVARTLPVTRIAHGFQVIESPEAIKEIKERGITLLMAPILNLFLGACVHVDESTDNPLPRSQGGQQRYLKNLDEHPIFDLIRNHDLKIAICSDNPALGGIPLNDLYLILAGLAEGQNYMPQPFLHCSAPLKLGELIKCLVNSIECAFCSDEIKLKLLNRIKGYISVIEKV